MINIVFINFIQVQYIIPSSSTSKLLAILSNLTLHICYIMSVVESITTVTTATDRTPILQRSLDTIHERASATQSDQHQSNTSTNNETSILQISNATHKYRSVYLRQGSKHTYGSPLYIVLSLLQM